MTETIFFTLKYVAAELNEKPALIYEIAIDMFTEDGCYTAYDKYPASSDRSTPITLFTPEGITYIREALEDNRDHYEARRRETQRQVRKRRQKPPTT
jgi:hypothetical protein